MTAGGVFDWVEPSNILKTQCSSRFNSILDFVFLANQPQTWQATSEILFPASNYCQDEDEFTSDHRPVAATIQLARVETDDNAQLLERLEELERQIEELRQIINERL